MDRFTSLLVKLHEKNLRQGPGSDQATATALKFTQLNQERALQIADLGCGTGAASLYLASQYPGHLYALDLFPEFLEQLEQRAKKKNLKAQIETLQANMNDLPFAKNSFDLIISEAAIYNMGFKSGIGYWQEFLRPGAYMIISELSWLRDKRPKAIDGHWKLEYPGIQNIAGNIQTIFDLGLENTAHFVIEDQDWLDYYQQLEAGFQDFLKRYPNDPLSESIVERERAEKALYDKYKDYFGYVYYVIRKPR